ncbi:Rne/Rng family ribonuclease [Geochorda subterranea]|uniref:Rne/Rng family ribonuclease n=1 Tax=Geochorda subterranea TaxID=3109564 RepID=A0ABZ1BM34_9FIRM|nr:Rne/Rng family ribonuclease [Limnochorda sp. LNt]WRP13573.1 Rne/Rng family ribonuclease [Limnochorda sp. LNt]
MRREILINVSHGETRAVMLEDGRLVEIHIEREAHQSVAGNIYKGRVENVLPGMQAAFVDIGLERNAFLYLADAPLYVDAREQDGETETVDVLPRRPRRSKLREGQEVLVQVVKDPIGTKGARVVTHPTLPGRYLVLAPSTEYVGISRRIADEAERNRLKAIARRIRPKGMGLIVRTVAEGREEAELEADLRFLMKVWDRVVQKSRRASAPALLYRDHDLIYRLVRDVFNEDLARVVIDARAEYQKVLELAESLVGPSIRSRVELYQGERPLFEAHGVEAELERALDRRVWLGCGGYLVIDRTEAFTSIDVNTGRYIGTTSLADTVLRTNLEAAVEIARQIRLRDLGGIILVDFIDMDRKEDRDQVLARLIAELARDRTRTHVLGFTRLGLVEMTRKKVREDLYAVLQKPCPYCQGSGRVLSEATTAHKIEREIRRLARSSDAEAMLVATHPSVAAQVIGVGGANLRRLESETGKIIYVRGSDDVHIEEMRVVTVGSRREVEQMALPVKEGQVVDLEVEEPHVSNPRDGIARLEGYVVDIEGGGPHVGQRLRVEITKVFRTYAKGRVVSAT